MGYAVYKGINKTVEFKGLRAQYLVYFVVGIIILFMLFIVLRMFNVNIVGSLITVIGLAFTLIIAVFRMNAKYGRYGLMKKQARRRCPRLLISRKSFKYILSIYKYKNK
jgi:predicted membrane chloride channel (bestrophin family)